MRHYTHGRVARQVRLVGQRAIEETDLCFGKLLPAEQVEAAIGRHPVRFRERFYTPLLERKRGQKPLFPVRRSEGGGWPVSDWVGLGGIVEFCEGHFEFGEHCTWGFLARGPDHNG